MTTTSTPSFRLIINAFDDYAKQVGEDLTKNPLADALRACDSPNAVLELLQERAHAFKEYREGNHKLIGCLKPVVQVVQGFSGVIGNAIGFVSRIRRFVVVAFDSLIYHQVPFPPASAIFVSVNTLLTVRILLYSSEVIFLISGTIRQPLVSARATIRL